ncbi:MAG: ATP-binding cassette domain-containing protein, partial [Burkholderiaceae bacterium]|nr:ATP-binding cassette domain-containing protein [Burkholderiaceae bacterium]
APPPARIAHVAQEIEGGAQRALDYVLDGHAPLAAARAQLAHAQRTGDTLALAEAHAHLAELDEGAIAARAATILRGLGFSNDDAARPVGSFSGGWRNRLALARALLQPADLLLLDEPTNHLDLDSVLWLESWLTRQRATALIVSHDREFLDVVCQTIWHFADGTIRRYAGNYSAFELAHAQRQREQAAAQKHAARTAAHLQAFVDRFRAKASKARQAQSRLNMLARLQAVEPVRAQRQWRFEFLPPARLPPVLIETEALALGYGRPPVLHDVTLSVRAGDRIGVLGVNGAGKSTLIKALAGVLPPRAGHLRRAGGVAVGYFAQHQLEQLDPQSSPLEHLRRLAPTEREQTLRDFLGRFRFGGELATRPVGPLSGGEKARCALALLVWQRPNLLVLDEPTNHLDLATREALTVALSTFEGALLLVSHDRHLLRATTDQLWLVQDGRVAPFEGDLEDYAASVLAARRAADAGPPRAPTPDTVMPSRRDERRRQAQQRQSLATRRRPLEQRLQEIERELAQIGAALGELDARLAAPDFYARTPVPEVAAALKQRGELAQRQQTLEGQWLEVGTALEALQTGAP